MGDFETVIAELRVKRDKITLAIGALEGLSGDAPSPTVRENRTVAEEPKGVRRVVKKGATAKAEPTRIGRPPSGKFAGVRERILEILQDGPQATGAIIACLRAAGDGASDQGVYQALSSMKSKSLVVRGKDGVWSLAK